jgi:hypothetical protein
MTDLEARLDFEHVYNPQHFYCRMIDQYGLTRAQAMKFMVIFDREVYQPIREIKLKERLGEVRYAQLDA